jgi:hypothetical protein
LHVDPLAQFVHPLYVIPPHCAYFATSHIGAAGAVGAAATLVIKVVGAAGSAVGAADGAGAGAFPVPSQTAGPGMGYVVAFIASGESMLKAMPGSVPV